MGTKIVSTRCGYCGAEVDKDDLVCEVCGEKFVVKEAEPLLCGSCGAVVEDWINLGGRLYHYSVLADVPGGHTHLCARCSPHGW